MKLCISQLARNDVSRRRILNTFQDTNSLSVTRLLGSQASVRKACYSREVLGRGHANAEQYGEGKK